MTAVTLTPARTPDQMVAEARQILEEAGSLRTWPQSEYAQKSVRYARERLLELLDEYACVLDGSMDPYAVLAPDMGWWDDPELRAAEWLADQALEQAKAFRRRLDEARRDEERRENAWTVAS